jgi:hypothetical protein
MTGYTQEEMLGRHVREFRVDPGVARSEILAKLAGTLTTGVEIERTCLRKDRTTGASAWTPPRSSRSW